MHSVVLLWVLGGNDAPYSMSCFILGPVANEGPTSHLESTSIIEQSFLTTSLNDLMQSHPGNSLKHITCGNRPKLGQEPVVLEMLI